MVMLSEVSQIKTIYDTEIYRIYKNKKRYK